MPAASLLMGTLLVRHRAISASSVEMSLDTAGTSAQCHLNKPPSWNSESSWGGPLVRAGPPGPAFRTKNQALASLREADVGVGRGPGGPPHDLCGWRRSALFKQPPRGPRGTG